MKTLARMAAVLALMVGFALPVAAQSPAQYISTWFAGTYKGVTPGNNLQVDVTKVFLDPQHLYDFFVTTTGSYQGVNIRLNGVIRFEEGGKGIQLTYIPKFSVTASGLSPEVENFTSDELESSCYLTLKPSGDGFAGDTLQNRCARAIRGAAGNWEVLLEPGTLRVKEKTTGETLRFERMTKK
jgi:hypothetical protein